MLAFFLIVLFVPIAIVSISYALLETITIKELILVCGLSIIIASISASVVYYSNIADVEIYNGRVTRKERERVMCSHSYTCRCRSIGSGKSRTTVCSTCYLHTHDFDWVVYTTNNERIEIARRDLQGIHEPKRWSDVVISESTSQGHSYENYIKAAPDTLFRRKGLEDRFKNSLPSYPNNIYDYYRLDRFVTLTNMTSLGSKKSWNNSLSELNADLGKKKEVNIIVVAARYMPQDWFYALEQRWIGGKNNDTILVVSLNDKNEILWANVMAWTNNEIFKIKLRDDILDLKTFSEEPVLDALRKNVSMHYKRKPMSDFEYLKASIVPTTTQWIVTLIITFILCGALTYYVHVNDVFYEERRKYYF